MIKNITFKLASLVNKNYILFYNNFNNNKLSFRSYIFLKVSIKIKGKLNSVQFKKNSRIKNSKLIVIGNKNIIFINDDASINNLNLVIKGSGNYVEIGKETKISKLDITISSNSSKLIIGNKTTVSGFSEIIIKEGESIQIGRDCMISRGVIFRTSDSHSIVSVKDKKRVNFAKSILIGDHVWIGQNVSILKGSEIKQNSIIASNTTITKRIDDTNVVIGSVPAKILKTNVNWDRKLINAEDQLK